MGNLPSYFIIPFYGKLLTEDLVQKELFSSILEKIFFEKIGNILTKTPMTEIFVCKVSDLLTAVF